MFALHVFDYYPSNYQNKLLGISVEDTEEGKLVNIKSKYNVVYLASRLSFKVNSWYN